MNGLRIDALRPLLWAVAIILFVIGGYAEESTTELWGWGFALAVAGMMLERLPRLLDRR
jgi:hypothetical protein